MPLQQFNEWSVPYGTCILRHNSLSVANLRRPADPSGHWGAHGTGTSVLTTELPGENLAVFLVLGL